MATVQRFFIVLTVLICPFGMKDDVAVAAQGSVCANMFVLLVFVLFDCWHLWRHFCARMTNTVCICICFITCQPLLGLWPCQTTVTLVLPNADVQKEEEKKEPCDAEDFYYRYNYHYETIHENKNKCKRKLSKLVERFGPPREEMLLHLLCTPSDFCHKWHNKFFGV